MPAARFENCLLAALSGEEFARWSLHLEWIPLSPGQMLLEPGEVATHVHFPTTAIVSLVQPVRDGAAMPVAIVGNDGVVGLPTLVRGGERACRAVVLSAGGGYRLPSAALDEAIERGGETLRVLLRYTQGLIVQIAQTAVCNRHHPLHQQLCRWLLISLDRLPVDALDLDPTSMVDVLGVPRDGLTAALSRLQAAGAIDCAGSRLTVLNRNELERQGCECPGVIRDAQIQLLPA